MTSEDVQLPRDQHARSPERAPSSLAQRVAHAVVESRGLTDVENDLQLGSEKTTQHAQSRTPIAALGIFFGLFLLIAWVVPSPHTSLGVPPLPERFGVVPTENRLVRAAQQVSAQSRAHQLEENSMRVLGRTGFVAVAAGGLGLAASSTAKNWLSMADLSSRTTRMTVVRSVEVASRFPVGVQTLSISFALLKRPPASGGLISISAALGGFSKPYRRSLIGSTVCDSYLDRASSAVARPRRVWCR